MKCRSHDKVHASLTEEAVMNTDRLHDDMDDWRFYRIEYGFECSCPEGSIWLPPDVDPDDIEAIINKKVRHACC